MTKILIVSDTHGNDAWLDLIMQHNYDVVIHAGDHLMNHDIKRITSYYVDGNNDWGKQKEISFELENLKFLLIHGDEQHLHGNEISAIRKKLKPLIETKKPDVLIFGHTHIPYVDKYNDTIILNPGSMSLSRHNFKKCYLELTINENKIIDVELKQYD